MSTENTIPGFNSIFNTSLSIKGVNIPVIDHGSSNFNITNSFQHNTFLTSNHIKLEPNLHMLAYNTYSNDLQSKLEQRRYDNQKTLHINLDEINYLIEGKINLLKEKIRSEFIQEIKILQNRVKILEDLANQISSSDKIIKEEKLENGISLKGFRTTNAKRNREEYTQSENCHKPNKKLEFVVFGSGVDHPTPIKKQKTDSENQVLNFEITTNKIKRNQLPESSTMILKKWFYEHKDHAYPTDEEKLQLKEQTNLTLTQINNWFTNARRRLLNNNNNNMQKNSKQVSIKVENN